MAKTNAERQKEFRDRKKSEVDEHGLGQAQLNMFISAADKARIAALAKRHGLSQSAMLSKIINESALVQGLEREKDDFLSGAFSGNGSDVTE